MLLALPLTAPFWAQNEAEIYRDVSPSVVSIEVEISWSDTAGGAGFVIDEDGHIVTNAHVVEDARALTIIFHDGYEVPAKLIGMDTRVDLAVIKVDVARHRLKPVTFGDSDALVVGEAVVAIGSPHGLDATLTRGIISGLNRSLEFDDGTTIEGAIQTDAALAPGNSGGPLLNQAGEVIGVNTAGYRGTALGFAIPSNTVQIVANYMIISPLPTRVAGATFTPLRANLFLTVTPAPTIATEQALHATFRAMHAATETLQANRTAAVAVRNTIWAEFEATRAAETAVQKTFEDWMTGTAKARADEQRATYQARATKQSATSIAKGTELHLTNDAIAAADKARRTATVAARRASWPILTPHPLSDNQPQPAHQFRRLANVECSLRHFTSREILSTLQIAHRLPSRESYVVTRLLDNRDISSYDAEEVADFTVSDEKDLDGKYHFYGRVTPGWYAITIRNYIGSATARIKIEEGLGHLVAIICTLPPTATPNRATVAAKGTANRATVDAIYARLSATPTPTPSPTATPYRVTVDSVVNLRSGPGTNHAKVGVARSGDTFAVIGYQAGSPYNWLKVRYDGGVAWIAESLARRVVR